jgi:hypothetical protein
MKTRPTKTNYSISYRIKSKLGSWSEWVQGKGQWQSLEFAQKQIKMIRQNHSGDMEIKFEKDGKLLSFSGEVINKSIELKTKAK